MRCGEVLESREISVLGHKLTEWNMVIEPTCMTEGAKQKECIRCDYKEVELLPATRHEMQEIGRIEASCTVNGVINKECSKCEVKEDIIIEAKGHGSTHQVIVTSPTYESEGVYEEICNDCGMVLGTGTIPKLELVYSENWTVDKEPTCTENGSKSKHCMTEGYKHLRAEVTEVSALGHEMVTEDYGETTCVIDGGTYAKCTRCDYVEDNRSNALGHDWNEGTYTAPTLESNGYTTYTCKRCGETKVVWDNPSTMLIPTKMPEPTATLIPKPTSSATLTKAPEVTITNVPKPTVTPTITEQPKVTSIPKPTVKPTVTEQPKATSTPKPMVTPTITELPKVTKIPTPILEPSVTIMPSPTTMPKVTEVPNITQGVTPTISPVPSGVIKPTATITPIVSPSVTIRPTEAIKVTITPIPSEAVKTTVTPTPSEVIFPTVTPIITKEITPTEPPQPSEQTEITEVPSPTEKVEITVSPKPKKEITPTEIPTIIETEKWITQQDNVRWINFLWIIILVCFLCILYFLLLFFYKRKRFHGIFADTFISGTKEKGKKNEKTKETWFVPELVDKVNCGEITIDTYIKTLKHCGVSTIFPRDTKMEISIQDDYIVLDANEKKLFQILQKAEGCIKVTFTSEDILIELIYYKK